MEYIAPALAVSYVAPETMSIGSGDPPSAAPSCYTCLKFIETLKLKANTLDGDTGNFELTGSGLESASAHKGSTLSETVDTFDSDTGLDLEGNNLESTPCLGKSFTNVAPVISLADAQASEKLAEMIGVRRILSGNLGLWALVVDAAPCDASAMSEGLLATLIQEDDTESEEPAARCGQDSLLGRTIRTGWEC